MDDLWVQPRPRRIPHCLPPCTPVGWVAITHSSVQVWEPRLFAISNLNKRF